MAIKRSRKQENVETVKRSRGEEETNSTKADRLTNLPEDLQIQILSSLETKHVFQTSMLLRSWSNSWTRVPILNFSSYGYKKLNNFDKFVSNALSVRGSAKLDKLIFKRGGTCNAKILNKVFDYAFSKGVKELEVSIINSRKDMSWPIMSHTSSDSITSLKLETIRDITSCSFLGPRHGSFSNLTDLYLKRAIITDLDPFSGFPALKKLALICCHLQTDGNTLNIHAPHLLELKIWYYNQHMNRCELATPKLHHIEFEGNNFPRLITQGGLPVLDTVVIDFNGFCRHYQERMRFDELLMVFNVLCNAKSVTVYSAVVHLLGLFPAELANRCSPFGDLKSLKVDFSLFFQQKLFEGSCPSLIDSLRVVPGVKGYLVPKSRDVKWTMVYPDHDPNEKPRCSKSHKCGCGLSNIIKL